MGTLVKGKFAVIIATAILILCVTSQIALASAVAGYQDEFNLTTLQSGWTFTNPNGGSYSLSANAGFLTITAAQNSRMGTSTTSNLNAPRMLQPVTGDFEAVTHVTGSFSTNYRGGILLWKDSSNFIAVENYGDNKAMIYTGATDGNQQTPAFTATNNLYLRMVKSGATVTGYYGTDGNTWTLIGSYPFSSADPVQIGLFTFNVTLLRSQVVSAQNLISSILIHIPP